MASHRGLAALRSRRLRALSTTVRDRVGIAGVIACACVWMIGASCAAAAELPPGPPAKTSGLDAPLFYQLLISELEAAQGHEPQGVELMLDGARRTRDEALFRRAAEMAIQARAGDQALSVIKVWRGTLPQSREAVQLQIQVLFALGKAQESAEPLRSLLANTPVEQRSAVIATLPSLFERSGDATAALDIVEPMLQPYIERAETRTAARVALARTSLAAGKAPRALDLARAAQLDDPGAPGPALVAVELMGANPEAEQVVQAYLARSDAQIAVRMVYARVLTGSQRLNDAAAQLRAVVAQQPGMAAAWLGLGAYAIELHQLDEADAALRRYLALRAGESTAAADPGSVEETAPAPDEDAGEIVADPHTRDPVQAWMMLSQVAELKGDLKGAQAWLDKIQSADEDLSVTARKAALLAKQGRIADARAMISQAPEREKGDARAKVVAESELLRDAKQPTQAYAVLSQANERFPDDISLLYDQAMLAEKLDRVADMERLLRRVIELKPDHAQAHNALGYSLADRNQRLVEARELIQRALVLSPGDPFIVDSLGWAEYRLGNLDTAIGLLRKAYASRSDTEIAAHLGEVLWVSGKRDEARRVWLEARTKDRDNEVLRQTLQRLKVGTL